MDALAHQKAALDEIVARAKAYFAGGWIGLPIQPRWASIMVGPTGTGKTAVAAMAARTLSNSSIGAVSMLRVSLPSWMPAGANQRGTKETVTVIAEHIARHEKTILVLDEAEKLASGPGGAIGGPGDAWLKYIFSEIFDLIDGRWPTGLREIEGADGDEVPIETLTEKLRTSVFVLAIGTFQLWFDSAASRKTMGFGAEINMPSDEISADIIARQMGREMANRFNSSIIRISGIQASDYQRIATEAARKLPERLQASFRAEVARRLPDAIATKKGVRFLEEVVMEVLKNAPEITLAESILLDGI